LWAAFQEGKAHLVTVPIGTFGLLGNREQSPISASAKALVVCSEIVLETGSAAQDYIGWYGGDAKLLSESLEYVQRTAAQILNAIGAGGSSVPPA
jgi:hypothetical protein